MTIHLHERVFVCLTLCVLICISPSASYHKDYEKEVRELNQQKMELELQFPSLCLPDPDLSGRVRVKYLL